MKVTRKEGKSTPGLNGSHLGKLETHWPDFFQVYLSLYENVIIYSLKSSLFVRTKAAVILPMKDCCSV